MAGRERERRGGRSEALCLNVRSRGVPSEVDSLIFLRGNSGREDG